MLGMCAGIQAQPSPKAQGWPGCTIPPALWLPGDLAATVAAVAWAGPKNKQCYEHPTSWQKTSAGICVSSGCGIV